MIRHHQGTQAGSNAAHGFHQRRAIDPVHDAVSRALQLAQMPWRGTIRLPLLVASPAEGFCARELIGQERSCQDGRYIGNGSWAVRLQTRRFHRPVLVTPGVTAPRPVKTRSPNSSKLDKAIGVG
jgi:hypothetical protein